jgi:hypothetical protein
MINQYLFLMDKHLIWLISMVNLLLTSLINGDINNKLSCFVSTTSDLLFNEPAKLLYHSFNLSAWLLLNLVSSK